MAKFAKPIIFYYASGSYIADDGGVIEKNKLQIENWYNHRNKGEQILLTNTSYQLLPNAEFAIQETYDECANQVNILWPQVKYLWLNQKNILSSAVVGANYVSSDKSGIYGNFIYIPTSVAINKYVKASFDIGWQCWNAYSEIKNKIF